MKKLLFLDPRGTAIEVVKAAKEEGWRCVAVISHPGIVSNDCRDLLDYTEEAPDWSDLLAVQAKAEVLLANATKIGVYFSMDACAIAGNHLRSIYGLPHIDFSVMELILDKWRLRKFLRGVGLSNLRCLSDADMEALNAWPFAAAAYFKPVHGFFSAYVTCVTSLTSLRIAQEAFKSDRSEGPEYIRRYINRNGGHFFLEEACEGELLSIETLTSDGKIQKLGILSRILYSRNHVIEMGSCFPYPHPQSAAIERKLREIHTAVGFSEGPAHTELIVTADGRIELIDFNPRIVGADVLWSINFSLGIELQKCLLAWATGGNVSIDAEIKGYSCLQYVLPPEPMIFRDLSLPDHPEIRYRKTFLATGTAVESIERQTDYLGCYLTFMPSFDAAINRSFELRDEVWINVSRSPTGGSRRNRILEVMTHGACNQGREF
jgi:ATP-grasp domain